MADGRMPLGPDPPVRVEVVGESAHTRVTRLFLPGRTVIRKQPLGPDSWRRTPVRRLRAKTPSAPLPDAAT